MPLRNNKNKKDIMSKSCSEVRTFVDADKLKQFIRDEIKNQFGSLHSMRRKLPEEFKTLPKNYRASLHPTGPVSFPILSRFSVLLGIGDLKKKTEVIRTTKYFIES